MKVMVSTESALVHAGKPLRLGDPAVPPLLPESTLASRPT